MSTIFWEGDLVVYNCLIYFITDLLTDIFIKKTQIFYIYHHISCIIVIYLNKTTSIVYNKIIELGVLQEISSIPLSLFHMGYISKPVYNILFSYSFTFIRFIYYNYLMYNVWIADRPVFNNVTISLYILMNLTNIVIAWKMKLVQKAIRPVIDLFSNKRAIK